MVGLGYRSTFAAGSLLIASCIMTATADAVPYYVLVTAEGDSGTSFTDKDLSDGAQTITTFDGGPSVTTTSPLSGARSLLFDVLPQNSAHRLQFDGSGAGLGTQFSLGARVAARAR